ncbi:protein ripply3 [Gastrophryne carolinensis]
MDSVHYTLKATLAHICCNSNASPIRENQAESSTIWRPWVSSGEERESEVHQRLGINGENDDSSNLRSKGAHGFQHPVRLYMPKSKTEEYLQHMGKKVLANFPVQATIHFYNDDSDSEEEDEDEMDYYNYYRSAQWEEEGSTVEGSSRYSSVTMHPSQ